MTNRLEVAREVHQVFVEAEVAAERSAAALARCCALLVEARRRAGLPPSAAEQAISLVSKSVQSAMDARANVLAAHPLLAQLGIDLDVMSFGPDGQCVPNRPFTEASSSLKVVGGVS